MENEKITDSEWLRLQRLESDRRAWAWQRIQIFWGVVAEKCQSFCAGSLCRIFCIFKEANVKFLPVVAYGSPELAGHLVKRDPSEAGRVGDAGASIFRILLCRCRPEIANSVVIWIAVDVVKKIFRRAACFKYPRKDVRPVGDALDPDKPVAPNIDGPGNVASASVFTWLDFPSKNASLRIVVKKLAQTLRGKIGLSHDAPVKRIGQRPVSVSSTCGLRYFSVSVGLACA